MYICIYIYLNMYIYIYVHMCKYIYVCVNLIIYISVCGGCLKMRCPLFLSKNLFRNQKRTPRFETYPCIYSIFIFWHVFFVSILCLFVPCKIYVFWFSFVCSFSASCFQKNVSNQKMFLWRLQYRYIYFVYKENEVSPSKGTKTGYSYK